VYAPVANTYKKKKWKKKRKPGRFISSYLRVKSPSKLD
jgi:hypothetical protein